MAKNVTIAGASYSAVPAIQVPITGGGVALFSDPSITTAVVADVAQGKQFLLADGSIGTGTASGGGVDFPVFTATVDVYGTVQSITCDKTYTQCEQLLENEGTLGAVVRIHPNYTAEDMVCGVYSGYIDYDNGFYAIYGPVFISDDLYDIKYRSNGSLELVSPSEWSGEEGTPTATKSAVSNHSIAVTPNVVNTGGFINGNTTIIGTPVTVSASELVSGSQTITSNNTYDVTNLASVVVNVSGGGAVYQDEDGYIVISDEGGGSSITVEALSVTQNGTYTAPSGKAYSPVSVNVSGGGGASNIITGTFKGTTPGEAISIALPYTGSGYPVAVTITPSEGSYNSNGTFYQTIQRYAIFSYYGAKSDLTVAPNYSQSSEDYFTTITRYKSSTSTPATISVTATSSMEQTICRQGDAQAAAQLAVKFNSATQMSVFIASNSYGFAANVEYTYHVIYSS